MLCFLQPVNMSKILKSSGNVIANAGANLFNTFFNDLIVKTSTCLYSFTAKCLDTRNFTWY